MINKIRGLRWWIVGLICLGTIINYLARNSLVVLAPVLQTKLSFNTSGVFVHRGCVPDWLYGNAIGLRLCARFLGPQDRVRFVRPGLVRSQFAARTCYREGSLAFFRGLLGLTEASAIPAGIKAISEWFPAKERSVAVGYFNAGTSLGALFAPPLVIWVLLQSSWQVAFVVTGSLGFIFAFLWWLFYWRQRSIGHLATASGDISRRARKAQRLRKNGNRRRSCTSFLLQDSGGSLFPRALAEPAWQSSNFWIPLYLANERHMNLKEIAVFAWLPFLAADLGGIFGGYLSPLLMKFFRFSLVPSRIGGIVLGALLMIGPGLHWIGSQSLSCDRPILYRRFRPPDDLRSVKYLKR